MTAWQRTERWLALSSLVAAVAALLGWVGAIATASGILAVALLILMILVGLFGVAWVMRPSALRWWSGLVVLVLAIGPAAYAFVVLSGPIAHVAGLFSLLSVGLCGMTVVRRYEMPPIGR